VEISIKKGGRKRQKGVPRQKVEEEHLLKEELKKAPNRKTKQRNNFE